MLRFPRGLFSLTVLLGSLFALNQTALAQTAQISEAVPSESLLGEQFCFTTRLTNSGPPGYGPYFRIELPVGLQLNSATFFGDSVSITALGTFPAAPDNELTDPRINQPVTGTPDSTLSLVVLPIGAVVEDGPALDLELCVTISPDAELGVPLPVDITPVYQFGDTATGRNGPIIGAQVNQNVTPVVVLLDKTDTAPEGERPPGQIWPFEYRVTADIASAALISPVRIIDTLPPEFQFDGRLTFTGAGDCSTIQLPPLNTPGGTLEIECVNVPPGQPGGDDIVVTYGGYISDVLSELSCDTAPVMNLASGVGTYQPPQGQPLELNSNEISTTLTAKNLAFQKTAAPGTVAPNSDVTFTLSGQLTEFDSLARLVITETLPDGLDFVSHGSLVINGNAVAITPAVVVNNSITTITYDVTSVTGVLPAGSSITLSYNARVALNYGGTGSPILAGDGFSSATAVAYQLSSSATPCSEGSGAAVSVAAVSVSKELLNRQPVYRPGDEAVFRLTQTIPAGSTRNVVFKDFLPLPALDADALNLNTDIDNAPGSVRRGPGDTAALNPASITVNSAQNAVTITWPDVSNVGGRVLQVDLTTVVTGEPFADGLFLTNVFETSNRNTIGTTISNIDSDTLNIAAPQLVITKGVSGTSGQGAISPPPSSLPINGNISGADGNDTISYRVTVENVGNALAYEVLVTDPGVPDVFAQCAVTSVTDSNGDLLGFSGSVSGGLTLAEPLGYAGAVPGDDQFASTAYVNFDCLVSPGVVPDTAFVNTASASWTALPGATRFPDITDTASGTIRSTAIQKLFVATSESFTSDTANPPRATIGEIVRYRLILELPEGEISDLNFRDQIPDSLQYLDDGSATVAFVSSNGGVTSSTLNIPNIPGNAADLASLPSAAITFPVPGGAIAGGPFNRGVDPRFNLGTVRNTDNDNDAEFVVLELNAVMSNVNAVNRDNRFAVFSGGLNLNGNSNAVRVRLAEPNMAINKAEAPTVGDAGDTIDYLIVLRNPAGPNVTPAFEMTLQDDLPAGLINATNINFAAIGGDCTNLGVVNNSAGDSLSFFFAEFRPGCVWELRFDATLADDVAPGTVVDNIASINWTGLPGSNGTINNPTGSSTPGQPGSISGERDNSGGVNDYEVSDNAPVNIPGVGIAKRVIATDQDASGVLRFRNTVTDLLIGEQATFELVATLPEGQTPSLIITDTLPFANGVMRLESARVVRVGDNLIEDNDPPVITQEDLQLMDGIIDTVSFDFGAVDNPPDGVSTPEDQVVLEVVATLVNVPANRNGDELNNSVLVQFGSGLNASATAPLDVIEPVLNIVKTGSIDQGDADDPVTYTVEISHAGGSEAIAQDLVFEDILPAELLLDAASIQVTSGPVFDVDLSSGNTVALGWDELPLGEVIVLQYQAQLLQTVQPGQTIINTADVEWDSIPGPSADQRINATSNSHSIIITAPGVEKIITATSEPGTGSGQFGPPVDLTIGELVTYRFTVELPEGTTSNAIIADQLPTSSSVQQVVSSQLVSIGASLSGSGLPAPGTAGVASDTNADNIEDRVVWTLGTILNTPDGVEDDGDLLTFEVIAVVPDVPANQSGDVDQVNIAAITSSSENASGTAAVDIVAPDVQLGKSVVTPADGFVDAGDSVIMRLQLDHSNSSTADSYDNVVTDTLPAGLSWVDDATVSSNCPGLIVDSTLAPDIIFSFPELTLTVSDCQIDYELVVDDDVQPTQQLQNSAMLDFQSTPVFVDGQTRRGMSSAVASVVVIAPTLVKLAVDTSQPDTGLEQGDPTLLDLTIGETVTYRLTLVFPEGVTPDLVLIDELPADANGVVELIGANVVFVGNNVSTSLPGTPQFLDLRLNDNLSDTARLDFGTVTNAPDGAVTAADRIVVEIVGRVVDVPANQGGQVLTNLALFNTPLGDLEDSADIEIVEPELALEKNMVLGNDGLVRISIQLENTGTAPAYDIEISDILDEADWLVPGLTPVSVTTGFELDVQADLPAPGQQTVRFATDPLAVSPAGTVPVGGMVNAIFEVPLAVLPPDPNPLPNEADLDAADTLPGDDDAARDLAPLNAADAIAVPDLQLLKTAALQADNDGSGSVTAGDTLRYTLVLENTGQATATTLVIDDAPDANSALIAGSVTSTSGTVVIGNTGGDTTVQVAVNAVDAGASVTITYDTLINNPLPAGVESVINQAIVDSDQLPPEPSDDPTDPTSGMDPTVVPIVAQPDLTLSKDDGGAVAVPGGVVAWTLTYNNVGTQDATGVVLSDTVPDNTTFDAAASTAGWVCVPGPAAGSVCTLSQGDLAVGNSGAATFAVRVDDAVPAGVEFIVNTARVDDDGTNGADPTPDNNVASDNTPLNAVPDLAISKDDGGATGVPGQTVTWNLQVTNVGAQGASGVVISDQVPANTQFNAAASTPGWSCAPNIQPGSLCSINIGEVQVGDVTAVNFAVLIDSPLPAGVRTVSNTATVGDDGANGVDPNPDNNTDSDDTPLGTSIDLAITKTDGGITVQPGDLISYTLAYENIGNQGVTGVVINETVPLNTQFSGADSSPGWVCVPNGAAGSSCSLAAGGLAAAGRGAATFAVILDDGAPETVMAVFNTVTITDDGSNGADINPSNNQAVETTPTDIRATLELVKQATLVDENGDGVGNVNETINYEMVATNTGNTTLTDVQITDPLIGALVCVPGQPAVLDPGATLTCTGSYVITFRDTQLDSVVNTAEVTGISPGSQTLRDTAQAVVPTGSRDAISVAIPVNDRFALVLLLLLMSGVVISYRRQIFATGR